MLIRSQILYEAENLTVKKFMRNLNDDNRWF